jgi:transcriptional regulator with PAS, ATPase and Fis domain
MHPFLAHFILNQSIESFPSNKNDKSHELIIAIQSLNEAIKGKISALLAVETAERVKTDQNDSNLLAMFLATWAKLSWKENRSQEGTTLIQRIYSLSSSALLPEVQAYYLTIEGLIASKLGDKNKREELGFKVLQILPRTSPRRKFDCMNHAYFLAQQGKAILIEKEILWLSTQCDESFPEELIALIRFTDGISAGRVEEASQWEKIIEKKPQFLEKFSFAKINYYNHKYILEIMNGRWNLADNSRNVNNKQKENSQYAQTIRSLLAKCPAEALSLARSYTTEYSMKEVAINGVGFESYNLLRAELSDGNLQAGKRILELRHERGNFHFIDIFFQTRIELLNKNFNEAVKYFKKAIEECEKFNATGRLDFEIRMACEWKPGILFELMKHVYKAEANLPTTLKSAPVEIPYGIKRIVGESNQIREIRDTIVNFANLDIPVLITGETGTGKELVARALHIEGPRKKLKYIAINCGAIADSLLESELFGHAKGAFTGASQAHKGFFETAEDGILFLDEIGEISTRLQISLLRVLETGDFRAVGSQAPTRIKCRLIFATNADLETLVNEGKFRKDLYYRLRRLQINIPPLRERASDIIPLADYFLNIGRDANDHARMTNKLQSMLLQYQWPGNIRELHNSIENMRLLNSDKLIYEVSDIKLYSENTEAQQKPKINISKLSENHQAEEANKDTLIEKFAYGNNMIRKEQAIKELFLSHNMLTRLEISNYLSLSPKTVTVYLKLLCDNNFIQKKMPSKSPKSHYFEITKT